MDLQLIESHTANQNVAQSEEQEPIIDLQEEIIYSSEEMAEMMSSFGRFTRPNRRNSNSAAESDFSSSMLEEYADEKLNSLVRQIAKLENQKSILNFVRGFFPNDSDLMLALREMLLNRKLSELQKKKVKEAIHDMEKFYDRKKIQSGINVGELAKRFKTRDGNRSLSAKDLRRSYLRFLECELPAGYLYHDWIDEFGCDNRKRILAFTLSALITDMKANEPGIHFDEFGLLGAKLSDARVLNTMDQLLNERFSQFRFREQMRNQYCSVSEQDIVGLYLNGIMSVSDFKEKIGQFSDDFFHLLLIKHRVEVLQTLRNIYNITPDYIFCDEALKGGIMNVTAELITLLYRKEKKPGTSV